MANSANIKRIVCLATSRKPNGRCVAGKEILENGSIGGWVRPISARETEEVSEDERQYKDGSEPRVLDVIDVPLRYARPKYFQQENWLLDSDQYWERVRRVERNELPQLIDPVAPLWSNGSRTFNGQNDRIHLSVAKSLNSSLRLIRVAKLELSVFQPGKDFGNLKRRVQGRFRYGGADYWLWVTDLDYEQKYLQLSDGNYQIGRCLLTISLGGSHSDDYSYKLIAAIIKF